ncbi:MAG TPA: NAD(P)H-dependent oxidoreductase subunit E [Dehalococcoidia bacterium]|nr:NAD(P)H-dependent oxidoreductase subunit E [Dehalococcoidia bacterium]
MANPSLVQGAQALPQEQEGTSEERLNEILSSYEGRVDELIPILQQVQQVFGYLPELAMKKIAKFLKLPESTVFGVGTFYAQFKLVPTGRNVIKVCRGTACHVRGSAQILGEIEKQLGISAGETTPNLENSIETIACFGSCALAPVVVINGKVHGRMTTPKAREILNKEAQ